MSTFKKRPPKKRAEVLRNHPGRTSFVAFIQHVRPDLVITPQIELLASKIEGPIVRGVGWLRLILVWPPRTGKSTAGSILFLAWLYGLHPNWDAIVGSLSGDFATEIGEEVRNIISSEEYRDVFPEVTLSRASNAKKHFKIVGKDHVAQGKFHASGRKTRITGRGSKILFVDDLLSEQEVDSLLAMKDAHKAIKAFRSRCNPAGFHWVICNTRYREDDPIGFIKDKYDLDGKTGTLGKWDEVIIPTLVEKGEEQIFDLGDGRKWIRKIGDVLYPYTPDTIGVIRAQQLRDEPHEWYGQHKGMPRPPAGRKLDGNDIRFYDEPVLTVRQRADRVVIIVDTARKAEEQNDPSAILVMGQQGQRHNALHCEAERWPFLDLCVKLAKSCLEWRPALVLLEDSANGTALYETLTRQGFAVDMSSGRPVQIPFHTPIELVPCSGNVGSKVMRFDAAVPPAVRQGWLWLPRNAPWRGELIEELVNFPRVAHDDRCDTMAIWFKWAAEHGVSGGQIEIPKAVMAAAAVPGRVQQRNEWQAIGSGRRW